MNAPLRSLQRWMRWGDENPGDFALQMVALVLLIAIVTGILKLFV